MLKLTAVLVAVVISCVTAQRISSGGCPVVEVKKDFDASQYAGVWYEIEKNPAVIEAGLKCNQINYTVEKDFIRVVNTGVNIITGKKVSIKGRAIAEDKNVPARMTVAMDSRPIISDYCVLDTDYDEYSLVYSCHALFNQFKAENIWILSRKPTLQEETKNKVYTILDDNKISRRSLVAAIQDC